MSERQLTQAQALCSLPPFKMVDVVTNDMGQPKLKTLYFHITETTYEYMNSEYTIAVRRICPLTYELHEFQLFLCSFLHW